MLKPPTSSLLQGNCLSWIAASNAALGRWPRLGCEHSRLSGDSGGWFPQGFDGDFSGMINGIYLDLLKISSFPTVKSTTWEIYIGYIEYVLRFWRSLSKFRLWLLNGDRMITMGYDMICSTIIKHFFWDHHQISHCEGHGQNDALLSGWRQRTSADAAKRSQDQRSEALKFCEMARREILKLLDVSVEQSSIIDGSSASHVWLPKGKLTVQKKTYDMYTLCVRYEIIQIENDTSCTGGLLFLFKYMSFFWLVISNLNHWSICWCSNFTCLLYLGGFFWE